MMLRTGDPAPSSNGLMPSALSVIPFAIVTPEKTYETGPPTAAEAAILTDAQTNDLTRKIDAILGGSPALIALFRAMVFAVGGLAKLPKWVYYAILAGIGIPTISTVFNRDEAIKGLMPKEEEIIPPDYGIGGPGIPEPKAGTFQKMWRVSWERRDGTNGYTWFWHMNDGYIISYTKPPGKWNRWKPVKPIAVLGRKMSLNTFLKADRYLDRFARRIAKRSSKLQLQRRGK